LIVQIISSSNLRKSEVKRTRLAFIFFLIFVFSLLFCKTRFESQTEPKPIDFAKINAHDLPFKFEIYRTLTTDKNTNFIPLDLDNDGIDEIIAFANESGEPRSVSYVAA